MNTDSLNAALASTATAQSASKSAQSMGKLAEDYQAFLTLLTAQIANQDPLQPMDSTQFVQQLAQMTQVEQAVVQNSNLEAIAAKLGNVSALSDVGLLGREVDVPTDRLELTDGSGAYSYELTYPAQSVKAVIRGEDGTVIRTIDDLPKSAGTTHRLEWDGRDAEGLPVPDGRFSIRIEAVDSGENALPYAGYARTRVEELDFAANGGLVLRNGDTVPSGALRRVY